MEQTPVAVSLRRLSQILGVDRATLGQAVRRGELPGYQPPGSKKIWVFISDGELWLRSHRVNPAHELQMQSMDPVVRARLEKEKRMMNNTKERNK